MKPAPRFTRPERVLPAERDWPLYGVAASRAIEQRALAACEPGALMRQAGLAVARLALALQPHAQTIWVAAGPGGNGGDGLHAAAELACLGRSVRVTLLADRTRMAADAGEGLQRALAAGVRMLDTLPATPADLAIDALLGLGATRAPQGDLATAIQALNGSPCGVLSVDSPSGLSCDTGRAIGADAVRARWTLALLTLKPGLFTASGRELSGEIWLDTLGVTGMEAVAADATLTVARPANPWLWPRQSQDSHKGRFGDVHVVGGSSGMVGAARLAAHAAQAAGAGRTFVNLLDGHAERGDISRPEWLWEEALWRKDPALLAQAVVVCGCGGGDTVAETLPALLPHAGALVLDADALNVVAASPALQSALLARAKTGKTSILTPHPLEAARLLRSDTPKVQADRLGAARELAQRLHSVVVLKGSGTVIAAPGRLAAINGTGNAALASGGSGDVLAGWIGGLWAATGGARVSAEQTADHARHCAIAACWLHGQAADEQPMQASRGLDLVQAMREVAARSAFGTRRT